jgi:hypothetical protein
MGGEDMRYSTALTATALTVVLACLGLAGTGDAQVPQAVQIQGTLQAADCQTGRVTFSTASGDNNFQATNQTAAYVNGGAVDFCSLQSYAGDSATAVLIPTGNAFELSQINVSAAPTPASGSTLSPVAIGIGALLLGGLIGYMVGHQAQPQPAYYPVGYAPAYLPARYPYNRAYNYQGHSYYRCSNGAWNVDHGCWRR